jgi:hypothetical protein
MENPIDKDKTTESPGILPYAHHVGSALIKPDNTDGFKLRGIHKVNRELSKRMDNLKSEYEKLMDEFKWNDIIYHSKISFEPLVGETYYLYLNKNDEYFLSIIDPSQWKQNYIGEFELNADLKWIKKD